MHLLVRVNVLVFRLITTVVVVNEMKLYSPVCIDIGDDKGEKHFDCFIASTCAKNRLDFYLQTRLVTQNTETKNN